MFEICKNAPISLSEPYYMLDEAVQAGFLLIRKSYQKWKFYEYGFWVIYNKETDQNGYPRDAYRYTTPQTSCRTDYIKMQKPEGIVKANCHTHPKSESFSSGDKKSFKKFAKDAYKIAFYLMTPMLQIKVATEEKDFLMGRRIEWLKAKSGTTPAIKGDFYLRVSPFA